MLLPLLATIVRPLEMAVMTGTYMKNGARWVAVSEVWLTTPNGESCLKLNRKEAFTGPAWADANRVIWVEGNPDRKELWALDARSFERKRILAVPDVAVDTDGTIQIGAGTWRMSGDRVVPMKSKKRETAMFKRDKGKLSVSWRQQSYAVDNPNVKWNVSATELREVDLGWFEEPYRTQNVELKGATVLLMDFAPTAHDVVQVFVKLDPKKKTAHVLPIDAAEIDLDEHGRFLAVSGRRLETRGESSSWVADVYRGDAHTLQFHKVTLPFPFTRQAALRPLPAGPLK